MWKLEKHLCEIGKTLDEQIDIAIDALRKNTEERNSGAVYRAIKAYFWHRNSCEKCTVTWRKSHE